MCKVVTREWCLTVAPLPRTDTVGMKGAINSRDDGWKHLQSEVDHLNAEVILTQVAFLGPWAFPGWLGFKSASEVASWVNHTFYVNPYVTSSLCTFTETIGCVQESHFSPYVTWILLVGIWVCAVKLKSQVSFCSSAGRASSALSLSTRVGTKPKSFKIFSGKWNAPFTRSFSHNFLRTKRRRPAE